MALPDEVVNLPKEIIGLLEKIIYAKHKPSDRVIAACYFEKAPLKYRKIIFARNLIRFDNDRSVAVEIADSDYFLVVKGKYNYDNDDSNTSGEFLGVDYLLLKKEKFIDKFMYSGLYEQKLRGHNFNKLKISKDADLRFVVQRRLIENSRAFYYDKKYYFNFVKNYHHNDVELMGVDKSGQLYLINLKYDENGKLKPERYLKRNVKEA